MNGIKGKKMSNTIEVLDLKQLRNALGNFATGVTVMTAQSASGDKVGVTANSFNSLSMEPPLILWSLDKRSASYKVFSESDYFAVNILSSDQVELSNHFATKQMDKFASVNFDEGLGKSPLLIGCAASFECKVHKMIEAGDHWLIIGEVQQFNDVGNAPLCFHKGKYANVQPQVEVC